MVFFNFTATVPVGGLAGYEVLKDTRDRQEERLLSGTVVQRETNYFRDNIANINSAEEFVEDDRILRIALEAYGLGEEFSKKAFIQNILESDLNDPNSAANRVTDPRWEAFSEGFLKSQIETPGPLDSDFGPRIAQRAYAFELTKFTTDTVLSDIESDAAKFRTTMKNITTADQLVADRDALNFVKEAFGLTDSTASNSEIVGYLNAFNEFSLNSDGSAVVPDEWKEARAALSFFNETFITGSTDTTDDKPNDDKTIEAVILERYKKELSVRTGHDAYIQRQNTFTTSMSGYSTAAEVVADSTAMTFLREAYNLTSDTTDDATVISYLTETDSSAVPSAWQKIREDLGLYSGSSVETDTDGTISLSVLNSIADRHEDFNISYLSGTASYKRFEVESDNFELSVSLVASDRDITSNSRVLRFALTAYGLESESYDSFKALNVLTGEENLGNTTTDQRWRDFQKDFSFTTSANTLRTQEAGLADTVIEKFADNTFIEAVGEQDENLRLALYFEQRIQELAAQPNIDNFGWIAVAGETPLANVFQTAFGLPTSFGQLDVDQQQEVYRLRSQSITGSPNLSSYGDSAFVETFLQTYLLRATLAANSGNDPVLGLF
ncbi:MAG: DUF1217 domain-containing protein [Pseudomonadota bacterium]